MVVGAVDSGIVKLQTRAADRWATPARVGFEAAIKSIDNFLSIDVGPGPQLSGLASAQVVKLGEMALDILLDMDELSGEDVGRCIKPIADNQTSGMLGGLRAFFLPQLRSYLEDGRLVLQQLTNTQPMGTSPPVADTRSRALGVCVNTAYALLTIAVVIDAEDSFCSCCNWSVLAGLVPTVLRASSGSGVAPIPKN